MVDAKVIRTYEMIAYSWNVEGSDLDMSFGMFMVTSISIILIGTLLFTYNDITDGNITRVLKKLLNKVKSLRKKDDLDKEIDCIEKEIRCLKDKKKKLQQLEELEFELECLLGHPIKKESAEIAAKRLNEQVHIFNDTMMTSDEASELYETIKRCGGDNGEEH